MSWKSAVNFVALILLCAAVTDAGHRGKTRKERRKSVKPAVRLPYFPKKYDWEEDMKRRGGIPNDGWSIYG